MPPKGRRPAESESQSSDDSGMDARAADFGRFMNPNFSREFIATLPPKVRDRVRALQALDEDIKALIARHGDETAALRRKHELIVKPLYDQRRDIVTGAVEPADDLVERGFRQDHKEAGVTIDKKPGDENAPAGLPDFWLESLRHHCLIDDLITERDAGALESLIDISGATLEPPLKGFTITFTFKPNDYFDQTVLEKTFTLTETESEMLISKVDTTPITWKEGKNLTMETVSKKQKSKKGAVRYVTREEPCDSFFNFFKDHEDSDDKEQWFSMAQTIYEKIVPRAAEYFSGEAPDGSSDIDDDEYGDEEEEEDEEDEEDDAPPQRGGRGGYSGAQAPRGKQGGKQPECKQQ